MEEVIDKVVKEEDLKDAFLGIDIGSVSCKFVLMDTDGNLLRLCCMFQTLAGTP